MYTIYIYKLYTILKNQSYIHFTHKLFKKSNIFNTNLKILLNLFKFRNKIIILLINFFIVIFYSLKYIKIYFFNNYVF
jgi:hypothetical protein